MYKKIAQDFRVKELLEEVATRMELFTYMEDDIYQYCMTHAKENPFRQYLEYLHDLQELSPEEEQLYAGIGREFVSLMETTDMQKVYKMPILYSFYNHGDIRMAVTEQEVLAYKTMIDRQHLSKAKTMPIHFLKASGKGFFIDKEGFAIALREDL